MMFKRTIPAVTALLLMIGKTQAQIIPNGSTLSSAQQVQYMPHAYSGGALINYVRTWEPWKPISVDSLVVKDSVVNVKLTTAYVDGLGRVIETVSKQASPNHKDMVAFKVFDDFGKEALQYLPYVSDSINGYFKTNPALQQQTYYSTSSKNGNQYANEQVYYGQTIFETSPLGRPDTVMAPGNSWAGSGRGVRYQYLLNKVTDSVRIWTITDSIGSTPATSATYDSGQLYKTVTIDEHDKQVIEYKDKQGQVILKKVQFIDSPYAGHTGWLCTYYIYDDYGLLRCVIQPEGVKAMAPSSWTLTSTLMNEQCFRYEYDQRNRMIIKKVPGAGEVWMVYDARDRLVMTQDANLRNGSTVKWLYTQYDASDRPVATGLLNSSNNRATHQSSAYVLAP
jgi:hypothetical protein